MRTYLLRRLTLFIPTAFGVSVFIFLMLHVIPGDYATSVLLRGRDRSLIATEEDFAAQARQWSEEPFSKRVGGNLGWVTRDDPKVFPDLREAIVAGGGIGVLPAGGRLAGPRGVPDGHVLLWLAERRPSPGWDVMSRHVHRELRKQLVEHAIPRGEVVTFLGSPSEVSDPRSR